MKIPIPKSTLLSLFPPNIQQDQIDSRSIFTINTIIYNANITRTTTNIRPRLSIAPTTSPIGSSNVIATEKEICLRFIGAFNILLTPLMLEYLTIYIEKLKTYDIHPILILDGLHFQAQTQSNLSIPLKTPIVLSTTKISLQLLKINVYLLQTGLAEDNVQLTEL
ncbi:unnamed protein product [Rotaria sp. Silwood1]|nr:unnamed protein product [Rotaria sp. Silwood1]